MVDGRPVLDLPPAMQQALAQQAPLFVPWRWEEYAARIRDAYQPSAHEGVFAVIADFNGDSVPDVALDGHQGGVPSVTTVLSSGGGFRIVGVTHGQLDPGDSVGGFRQSYLRVIAPRTPDYERLPVTGIGMPRYDGAELQYPEYVAFWQGERFVQYIGGE
jgi:hypothetical protein